MIEENHPLEWVACAIAVAGLGFSCVWLATAHIGFAYAGVGCVAGSTFLIALARSYKEGKRNA